MKIVSKHTLQKLIRHQLLEHYTKKFNLLTEAIALSDTDLKQSLNTILPEDSSTIFNKRLDKAATTSQLGHLRTTLILLCLYELINNTEITKILESNKIIILGEIKNSITSTIKTFFKAINLKVKKDTSKQEFDNAIKVVRNDLFNMINSTEHPFPDFFKFLLKNPAILTDQIGLNECTAANGTACFKDKAGDIAVIINPVYEGAFVGYEANIKPKVIEPLKEALQKLIPQFNAAAGVGDSSATKPEDNKNLEDQAAKQKSEKDAKIKQKKEEIQKTGGISAKTQAIEGAPFKTIKLYLTELYVYHLFLNAGASINNKDKNIIYASNENLRLLINEIVKGSVTDNLTSDELQELTPEQDKSYYDIFWVNNTEETELKSKTNLDVLTVIENKRKLVLDKINQITSKTPVAFKIKLFLKELQQNNFEPIFQNILDSRMVGSWFRVIEKAEENSNSLCPARITSNQKTLDAVGKYFSSVEDFRQKITDAQATAQTIEKQKKELNSISADDSKADNLIKSPNGKVINDENWTKIIKKIEEIKKQSPDKRNPKEIATLKQIIKNLKDGGIDTKDLEKSLQELEEKKNEGGESEKGESSSSTKSDDDKDGEENKDDSKDSKADTTDSTPDADDNELQHIFRLPQLNKGWRQLAQILLDANALRNYKSGNFKREKYDKADAYGYIFMDASKFDRIANLSNVAIKTLEGLKGVKLGPQAVEKIENQFKDFKKIGNYLNDYFNKKMLLANEYLLIDVAVIFYLVLRVLEDMGLNSSEFERLHQKYVVDKDPVVLPHNIKIENLDDALAKKVDLSKRISIDQMFQNRKAKAAAATAKNQKSNVDTPSASNPEETNSTPTPIEDEGISAEKSLKRVKALITQLGGKMFKEDIENDDLVNQAAGGQYSIGQLGKEIVSIANTVYQRSDDFEFSEFEKKQLKLGLQNYFEQKLSGYNNLDDIIVGIKKKINQF